LFLISDIRLGKETVGFVVKEFFFKLVETVYTSIGIWGPCLIRYEKQPETPKKIFTGQDNTLTGSLAIKMMGRRKDKENNFN
jgi:hypothetical protein